MPIYKNITVEVKDVHWDTLREYGAQTHNRSGLQSCYIESKDGMRFKIFIKVNKDNIFGVEPKRKKGEPWKPTPPEEIAKLALFPPPRGGPSPPYRGRRRRSPSPDELPFKAPWHFLVSVHLDGREEADATIYFFLDGNYSDREVLEHAIVQEADGSSYKHYWSFKGVGVESVFDQLDVNLNDAESEAKVNNSTGQIEVRIRRIALGPSCMRGVHSKYAADAEYSAKDSHVITRKKDRRVGGVEYSPAWQLFDPNEETYARFKFYYREERVLKRMGLLGKKADEVSEDMEGVQSREKHILKAESGDVGEIRKKVKAVELEDDEEWY